MAGMFQWQVCWSKYQHNACSRADQKQDKMKGQPKEPKPKSSNRRKNNQNPKLNTYSRLMKTIVNGGNGGKKNKTKRGGLNSIITCELGSPSLGVAGSRIRSWRAVKVRIVQAGRRS